MILDESGARAWLEHHVQCDSVAWSRLLQFCHMIIEENERQNLISASTVPHIWYRHIIDSAQLITFVSRETSCWLDIGTGAGFPGLVIAILRPNIRLHLVEMRGLRSTWLDQVVKTLGLQNVTVHAAKLATVDSFCADVITARGFTALSRLVPQAVRFSNTETIWVLPKGRTGQLELDSLKNWRHTFHVKQSMTAPDAGIIVGSVLGRLGSRRR